MPSRLDWQEVVQSGTESDSYCLGGQPLGRQAKRERVAVVGAGISGLCCAYELAADYDVTVFEREPRLGGHTRTIHVEADGGHQPVDIGFIVFNVQNYPAFTRLLQRLDVSHDASDMSFGLEDERDGFCFSPSTVGGWLAQPSNLLRPEYWKLLGDISRFRREATEMLLPDAPPETIGSYLGRNGYSRLFRECMLLPMCAAIWSATADQTEAIPGRLVAAFFKHHRFLEARGVPTWRYLPGGSTTYVAALRKATACTFRTGCPVRGVVREQGGVTLKTAEGAAHFDRVILACHAPEALAMLEDATSTERVVLQAFPYQPNVVTLHSDTSVLPGKPRARASWNYRIPSTVGEGVVVSYWMNRLQRIPGEGAYCVTLNDPSRIDDALIHHSETLEHPVYTTEGESAKLRWPEMDGEGGVHFCGAYWGYGFHEDGAASAMRVVEHLREGGA